MGNILCMTINQRKFGVQQGLKVTTDFCIQLKPVSLGCYVHYTYIQIHSSGYMRYHVTFN